MPDDYVSKDLRMIFSISKQRAYINNYEHSGVELSPADRIEYLKITLRIPDDTNVRFTGWNMFTTEYGAIDIADVSFNRSLEIDASAFLSADGKDNSREVSAGGKTSASRREDQEIKYLYLKLNGRINSNKIEMEEEGTREIDLTGNIMADLSLEFDRFPERITGFIGLKDSSGRFNQPERLIMQHSDIIVPGMENMKDTLYADLKMDYIFRNVINGQETYPEWDDRVRYLNGSVSKRIALFTSNDYVPDFYCIGKDKDPDNRNIIKMSSPGNKEYDLIFRTYTEAKAFHEWLSDCLSRPENRNRTISIGECILRFRDGELKGEMSSDLGIIPYYR
jgi:hypothetical protein